MSAQVSDPACVFCRIIRGEIPAQRVFEDSEVLAFLDINPLAPGHTILIPKHHSANLEDLPPQWAVALGRTLGRLAGAITAAVGAAGYNLLQNNGPVAGQLVPHVHFHIIPRRPDDGLGYRWKSKAAGPEELARVAEQVRARL